MVPRFDTVSFLSDYGTSDEFVGVVKSVIRDLAPHVTVIDLTHDVTPFDVRAGSLALARCVPYVAAGVVLAVVDPGVGTDRRAVAIEVAGGEGVIVGPDNGLLPSAVAMTGGADRAVVLSNPEYQLDAPGPTFAGRDVFAPAAAHLCNGVDLEELGEPIDPALLLPGIVPLPREVDDALECEVLWVDRFGNVQLNVSPDDLDELWGEGWGDRVRVTVGEQVRAVPIVRAYGDIAGGIGMLVDSYGMYSLAVDRYSAADELHLAATDSVTLERYDEEDGRRAGRGVTTPVTLGRADGPRR
jgi:S-adenosylmethionine hydrolase